MSGKPDILRMLLSYLVLPALFLFLIFRVWRRHKQPPEKKTPSPMPWREPIAWVLPPAALLSALGFVSASIVTAVALGPGTCHPGGLDARIQSIGFSVFIVATVVLVVAAILIRHQRWLMLWLSVGLILQLLVGASGVIPRIAEAHCKEMCDSGDSIACFIWGRRGERNGSSLFAKCREGHFAACMGVAASHWNDRTSEACDRIAASTEKIPFNVVDDSCPNLPCGRFVSPPARCKP